VFLRSGIANRLISPHFAFAIGRMCARGPFRRVLLKISGEALKGDLEFGIDYRFVNRLAADLAATVRDTKVALGVVIGGGNFIRGSKQEEIDRTVADYMGMLSTVINAMALQAVFERHGMETRVLSAIDIHEVAEPYIRRRAIRHLEKGRVVIFAGGTGNPFFTTDTAAALRGAEMDAEVILKATNVDGVYSADPRSDPNATLFREVTFGEALARDLRVMDATAISMCRENNIPIIVFNLHEAGSIRRVIMGEDMGTYVGGDGHAT